MFSISPQECVQACSLTNSSILSIITLSTNITPSSPNLPMDGQSRDDVASFETVRLCMLRLLCGYVCSVLFLRCYSAAACLKLFCNACSLLLVFCVDLGQPCLMLTICWLLIMMGQLPFGQMPFIGALLWSNALTPHSCSPLAYLVP